MANEDAPKLIIDSDWKAQAQAEKEKLAEKAKADPPAGAGGPGQMPAPSFEVLLSGFVTQALFALGAIPDPQTNQPMLSLELA